MRGLTSYAGFTTGAICETHPPILLRTSPTQAQSIGHRCHPEKYRQFQATFDKGTESIARPVRETGQENK